MELLLGLSVRGILGLASYWVWAEYLDSIRHGGDIGWWISSLLIIIAEYERWWHRIISWVAQLCLVLAFVKFDVNGWWWFILIPFPQVSVCISYYFGDNYQIHKMYKEHQRREEERKKKELKNIAPNALEIRIAKDKAKPKENNSKIKRIVLAISRYGGRLRNYNIRHKMTSKTQSSDERMISTIKWVGGFLVGAILALCACIVICEYTDDSDRYQQSGTTLIDTKTNSVLIRRGKEWKWEPIKATPQE